MFIISVPPLIHSKPSRIWEIITSSEYSRSWMQFSMASQSTQYAFTQLKNCHQTGLKQKWTDVQ